MAREEGYRRSSSSRRPEHEHAAAITAYHPAATSNRRRSAARATSSTVLEGVLRDSSRLSRLERRLRVQLDALKVAIVCLNTAPPGDAEGNGIVEVAGTKINLFDRSQTLALRAVLLGEKRSAASVRDEPDDELDDEPEQVAKPQPALPAPVQEPTTAAKRPVAERSGEPDGCNCGGAESLDCSACDLAPCPACIAALDLRKAVSKPAEPTATSRSGSFAAAAVGRNGRGSVEA